MCSRSCSLCMVRSRASSCAAVSPDMGPDRPREELGSALCFDTPARMAGRFWNTPKNVARRRKYDELSSPEGLLGVPRGGRAGPEAPAAGSCFCCCPCP